MEENFWIWIFLVSGQKFSKNGHKDVSIKLFKVKSEKYPNSCATFWFRVNMCQSQKFVFS